MTRFSSQHRWIYLFGLALVAIGLPFSKGLISIGEMVLAANFLLEGRWKERIEKFKSDPTIWFFLGLYVLHLISIIWTSDVQEALKELRIKLPLLIFPIVIPLSQRLKRIEFLSIAAVFSGSVILASIVSTHAYFQLKDTPGFNFRDISLFTSHIRYSLMVCLSYIILLNCAWVEKKKMWLRFVYLVFALWLSVFIFILQSMTGIVIWLFCSYMLLFYSLFHIKQEVLKTVGLTILIVTPLFVSFYVFFQIDAFYPDKPLNASELERMSVAGNYYHHDTASLTLENGHYINIYISPLELQAEWDKRSKISYVEGKDAKDQYVYTTLIRYMTSKGLRKDSVGFSSLTLTDIAAIENGTANVRFLYGNALDNRIYTIIWELDKMFNEDRVQGHSVTQRFEFWKTAWSIFQKNWIIGVGSGDANLEFDQMYDDLNSNLAEKFRLRSHNQFLTIGVRLGSLGLLVFLISIVLPFLRTKSANSFLYVGFAIILYASMLNEDTLDTQVGVTLYAMFNSFLLYSGSGLKRLSSKTDS
jgi:O-antigen ligase